MPAQLLAAAAERASTWPIIRLETMRPAALQARAVTSRELVTKIDASTNNPEGNWRVAG